MTDQRKLYELGQGRADSTEGVVLDVEWSTRLAIVNVNGIEYRMPWAGTPPWPADRVRVIRAGASNLMCVVVAGAPMGTVLTTTAGVVSVVGDDGVSYLYPHLGAAPANGARVRVDHAGRCVLEGSYSTEPAGSDVTPVVVPSPPPVQGGSAWFTPTWSGGWRLGSYVTPYVETSYNRVAGWGFGSTVADTIPDTATIRKAELHLVVNWDRSASSTPVSAGVHGYGGRPGVLSAGDISGSVSVGRGQTVVDVMSVINDFKTGAARGFGVRPNSSYWVQYDQAPNSGRLYVEWRA
ncbi:hypothetical protein [uncultured Microbacterium sp.]|uniref:hypothetical protein n=1 Tax=uncultured Microbacterium sp. TaxID=191216 RepID=UPI00261D5FF9|nr:hypothetical protein [uncultured Microbacterium sp.]